MSYDKTARILNQLKPQAPIVQPIATEMILPNHSGIASNPDFKNAIGDYVLKSGDTMTGKLNSIQLKANWTPTSLEPYVGDFLSDSQIADTVAMRIASTNENSSAMWLTGQEKNRGTLKISHLQPSVDDSNAAAISIDLKGNNTKSHAIYIDSTDGGHTGEVLDFRTNGVQYFSLNYDGKLIVGDISFNAVTNTIAGIQNQNLVDKTDTETISGAWTFGASGTGTTVIFNSDASGVNLTWDHDATAGNPLLAQTIENSRTSYWKISGTDTSPATMSEGILSVVPTFTTGTAATGANLLFFKPTDSRSISSGTNFTRGIRIEPNRSGTKTSTGSDDLFGISIVPTDGLTINASSGTTRRYGVQASAGSTITLSQGGQTYENRNFLADGSIALINSNGTNTSNVYGLEIADSYTEALIGGSITATKIGVYYHPTMNSAADVEYALLASRSGIGLLSDGATGTYSGGNLYLGAGKDAEIYYDGTDLCIGSALVGSGTINLTDHTASSITTETLSEYITIKVNGTSKKIAIVA